MAFDTINMCPDYMTYLKKVSELSSKPGIKQEYQKRRDDLIKEKIDVSAFLIWLFENYPKSIKELRKDIDCQNKFISKINE